MYAAAARSVETQTTQGSLVHGVQLTIDPSHLQPAAATLLVENLCVGCS